MGSVLEGAVGAVWPRPGTRNISGLTVPVALTPLQPVTSRRQSKRIAPLSHLQLNRIAAL
jgi:hypothetical protein